MSKNGVLSGPYFPVFGLNTGKYGPEKTPYLDIFTQCNLFQILGNIPSTSVARLEWSDAYISCIIKSNCEMQELSAKNPDRHKHSIKKTVLEKQFDNESRRFK